MRRRVLTAGALGAMLGVGLLGGAGRRPAALAAPVAKASANPMADLLGGRLYPKTIKRDALVPAYHFVTLLDGQGKPAECATKGDLVTMGGETFLVAYLLFNAPTLAPRPADALGDAPAPPDAQLTLINMRFVQALGGIRDTPTPPAPAEAAPPTPAPGTAAP